MKIVYWANDDRDTAQIEILFPLPPDQDDIEMIRPKQAVSESITGRRQVVTYSNILLLEQSFSMLPRDFVTITLKNFFLSHALRGLPFRYFLDPEGADYQEYTLDKREFMPKKNKGTIDRYDIKFVLRRAE